MIPIEPSSKLLLVCVCVCVWGWGGGVSLTKRSEYVYILEEKNQSLLHNAKQKSK